MPQHPSGKPDRWPGPGYRGLVAVQTPVAVPRFQLRPSGPVEPLNQRLLMLAAVGGGGLALAAVYKLSGGRYGVPCILHATTGLDCPLCGTTRMTAALMRGDFVAAWDFNAPMLFIAPLAGILVGYQLTAWSLERARLVRLPRLRLSSRRERLLTNVLIAGLIVFGVLRNIF
jgi:Protein of unknown function (DUF2752)